MFVGTIRKGISLKGYIDNGLIDSTKLQERHDALAKEIEDRGFKHSSPLIYVDALNIKAVDSELSIDELTVRCAECCARYEKMYPNNDYGGAL